MKKCPFCAEEVQDDAIICKHCKSNLTEPAPQSITKTETESAAPPKKSSALGGLGLLLIFLSIVICFLSEYKTFSVIVVIIGAVILAYALLTGRINLFGNK